MQDKAFRAAGGGRNNCHIGSLHAFSGNPLARPLTEADGNGRSHPGSLPHTAAEGAIQVYRAGGAQQAGLYQRLLGAE